MSPKTSERLHLSYMKPPKYMRIQSCCRILHGWCKRSSSSVWPQSRPRTETLMTPSPTSWLVYPTDSDALITMRVSTRCLIWQTRSIPTLPVFVLMVLHFWFTLMSQWRIDIFSLSPTCLNSLSKVFSKPISSVLLVTSMMKNTQTWCKILICYHERKRKPYFY